MLKKKLIAPVAIGTILASPDAAAAMERRAATAMSNNGFTDVVEAFEAENPDISVKLEMYPYRQLLENIEVKLSSESQDYDVISVDGPLVANYTVKGFLEPLDESGSFG